jgi:hypothetical protein
MKNKIGDIETDGIQSPDGAVQSERDIRYRPVITVCNIGNIFRDEKLGDVAKAFRERIVNNYIDIVPYQIVSEGVPIHRQNKYRDYYKLACSILDGV